MVRQSAEIITDVEQFSDGLLMGFAQLIHRNCYRHCAGHYSFMLTVNVQNLHLVVVLITPVSFFVASFIAKENVYDVQSSNTEKAQRWRSLLDQMSRNQKVVQAFGYAFEGYGKIRCDMDVQICRKLVCVRFSFHQLRIQALVL